MTLVCAVLNINLFSPEFRGGVQRTSGRTATDGGFCDAIFYEIFGCVHDEIVRTVCVFPDTRTAVTRLNDLLAAGIRKEQIVLAFKSPRTQAHSGFAVA